MNTKYAVVQFARPSDDINAVTWNANRHTYTVTDEQATKLLAQNENDRFAVVKAPGANGPVKLVKVCSINDLIPTGSTAKGMRPVIDVIDMRSHYEHEAKLVRIAELENHLKAKAEQAAEAARLAALAGADPSVKALIEELQKLKSQ